MFEGPFFLLAMIATVLVIYWSANNDRRPLGQPISGLFAYRPGREPPRINRAPRKTEAPLAAYKSRRKEGAANGKAPPRQLRRS